MSTALQMGKTAVCGGILFWMSVKPLDILEETLGHVPVGLVTTKLDIFEETFQSPGHRVSQNMILA